MNWPPTTKDQIRAVMEEDFVWFSIIEGRTTWWMPDMAVETRLQLMQLEQAEDDKLYGKYDELLEVEIEALIQVLGLLTVDHRNHMNEHVPF